MVKVGWVGRTAGNYNPPPPPEPPGELGWTPDPPLISGRNIYTSWTDGHDSNTGNTSTPSAPGGNGPLKTPGRARDVARDNYGDHVLFKRTDVWGDSLGGWDKRGRPGDPMFIGAYGSLALDRPKFRCPVNSGFVSLHNNQGIHHLQIKDLEATPISYSGTTEIVGLQLLSASEGGFLLEGCYIHGFTNNMILVPGGRVVNVKMRRNVIADAWALQTLGHGSGLYCWRTDNLLLDENVFEHNGWNEAVDLGLQDCDLSHNLYMAETGVANDLRSYDAVIRSNMFSSGSLWGCMARSGGTIVGNVLARNGGGIQCGSGQNWTDGSPDQHTQTEGTVHRNIVLDGRDVRIDTNPANLLGTLGIHVASSLGVVTTQNAVVNKDPAASPSQAYDSEYNTGCTWSQNVAKGWGPNGMNIRSEQVPPANDYVGSPPNDFDGVGTYNLHPRTVELYARGPGGLGAGATHATMMGAMRNLRRGAWNLNHSPVNMNTWLLAGYNL